MATYDDLLVLENKLKTPQRDLQFLAIEIYKSKNKTKLKFQVENIIRKIFTKKGYFHPNSKRKLSEIWNKFIKFQRKCFVEQLTNKVKKL